MEQQVKERLVGAAILVALAVILIPELLGGRKDDGAPALEDSEPGRRIYTIELGSPRAAAEPAKAAQAGAAHARPTLELPARLDGSAQEQVSGTLPIASSVPVEVEAQGVSTPASPSVGAPEPAAQNDSAVVAPASVAAPPPAKGAVASIAPADLTTGTGGAFSVQVGAFGSEEAASRLVRDLEQKGYQAYVAPVDRAGKTLHRVRVGPVPDRNAAAALAARLQADGLPASLVGGG